MPHTDALSALLQRLQTLDPTDLQYHETLAMLIEAVERAKDPDAATLPARVESRWREVAGKTPMPELTDAS